MRSAAYRVVSLVLAAVFVLSGLVSGTLGWQSLSQQARNDTQSKLVQDVELLKLQKLPDGTETQIPVPGAVFYLFTKDGVQIGGRHVTGEEGKIPVRLEPGDYYFEEFSPAPGFAFDTDADGSRITRYPFTVTGNETETVVVTAYNVPLQGALTIEKTVRNADGSPLTEAQKQQEFVFTVTFSDGGTYAYRIDGGEPQQLASGGTLVLKHGQQTVFEALPKGVTYTVTEQPVPGYTVSGTGHTGTITEAGSTAHFVNTYAPEKTGSLTVSKEVRGDGADLHKEFTFTAIIGGQTHTFTLRHGESHIFPDLPIGTEYTITETDYTADGYVANVKTYTGTITGEETLLLPFVNVYQPEAEPGSLRITKEVVGENPDPDKLFTFEVEFSDGKGYPYSINGGELIATTGPIITLQLKGGQTARFEGVPEGVTYTVRETDPAGYRQDLSEAGGTIIGDSAYVIFRNRVPDEPATLIVTKQLAGDYPEADKDKEFRFTLTIDGVEQEFTLKPGERKEFAIPAGASYDVREDNYFQDGYALIMENGTGTALPDQTINVTATNTYIGEEQTEIEGEKTWELDGHEVVLPESITVQLKNGDLLIEEVVVTPDENGEWHYSFTAPKYDADGKEITYTIEELPVQGFVPTYNGYDIVNTYIPPVEIDPPIIEKVVEGENPPETGLTFLLRGESGTPMPEGSAGNTKTLTLSGSGEVEIGAFTFAEPGIYTYTVSELNTGADGWTYDNTVYTLTFTVTLEDGALHASYTLTKDGEATDKALFVNRYAPVEPDTVEISGAKTWNHGDNPNPPESIIVYVYADGELAAQRLVTERDNWQYAFTLPRYAQDGHEIAYTVGEAEVPGYTAEIHGYDIHNTYTGTATPEPPDHGDEDKPAPPGPNGPQTGDNTVIWPWVMAMVLSLLGILVTLTMEQHSRRRGKHLKRR